MSKGQRSREVLNEFSGFVADMKAKVAAKKGSGVGVYRCTDCRAIFERYRVEGLTDALGGPTPHIVLQAIPLHTLHDCPHGEAVGVATLISIVKVKTEESQ